MSTPVALVIGFVVGAALLAVIWGIHRASHRFAQPEAEVEAPAPHLDPATEAVLRVLRSATVVVGPHDEILHASPQSRSFGLVRGTRVSPDVVDVVRQIRGTAEVSSFEIEHRTSTLVAPMLLTVRVAPLPEDQVLVLADDRTAAARVEATRRDFTTNVSHELKTPIGAVSLLAEAVENAADDPPMVRNFAARLQAESARLTALVAQIIQLSRLQADDPLLTAEVLEVTDLLVDAREASQALASSRSITVTVVGDDDCRVLGDPGQLALAVSNLVSNAIAYSDPGAKVVLSAVRRRDGELDLVEINVSDNGIGIGAEELDRIFERFYRVDYARSRENGGTGLGLSIVKHVAAAHGGSVGVWSKLGAGSTFTIRIPAQRVHHTDGYDTDDDNTDVHDTDDSTDAAAVPVDQATAARGETA